MEKGHVIDFAAGKAKVEAAKKAKFEALLAHDLSNLGPDETFKLDLKFDEEVE